MTSLSENLCEGFLNIFTRNRVYSTLYPGGSLDELYVHPVADPEFFNRGAGG